MRVHSILTTRLSPPRGFSSGLIRASGILVLGQAIVIATLGHRTLGPLVSDVTQLALGLICILACTQAFRRSRGIARYAWRLMAVGFVVWAVAQALTVYSDISGDHLPDSFDDILFFFSVIPFGMLPFLDPDGEPNHFDRLHILDFVQVCILSVSIFLCFSPRMWSPAAAFRIGHFTWSRNISFDGLLVVTFVLRALLTKSKAIRWLFGRMALFLLLSGLADSYALSPGQDLQPGGWFDLIWSALLGLPILIAATWKNEKGDQTDGSPKFQSIVASQVFPLAYPLISFFVLARVHQAYPIPSTILFALAFMTFAVRVLVIQQRQGQSKEALRQSEMAYRLLFDSNPLPMWVFERKTLKFLAANEAASRQYGFSRQEFLTMTIADIRPEEDIPDLLDATANPTNGHQEATLWRHRKKDGTVIDVEIIGHDLYFHGIEAELIAARDISDRKLHEEMLHNSENKYRVLFEDSADANWLMDERGFLACNSAALRMFGYSAVGEMPHPSDISPLNQPDGTSSRVAAEEKIAAAFRNGTERFEWLHQRKNSDVFPAEVCLTALTLSGRPRLLATVRDITDRKVAEKRIQYLALHDALTGLPNRTLLQDRLAKALAAARRQEDKVALLFLDLDRFKDINDSLGHSVGDLLLQAVAERLKTWGREQDTVARLGGDEFLITVTDVKDVPDAAVAGERLMDAMTAEFVVQGHSLCIGCSIGISIFPEHGTDTETLIKNADAAMYKAKEGGRNNFRFFTDDMNAQVVERLTLENSLRLALGKKELFLVYQPQMDIGNGRIIGLEALLRWQHPTLGLVPPDKFIQIAENSGLIVPIGEWVLRTACAQARKWQNEGLPAVTMAVNVSAVQFRQEGFCDLIKRVLHETSLAPQYLELELTESLLLANAEMTLSVVHGLKAMGVTLAIDDFGTGYSNFTSLRQFGVGKLKIDRSFIRDVAMKPDDAAITAAIISMAKSLNLKVIAEGVEDEAQMSFLRTHHCDEIQGYYFSRPLAVDKVADKLRGEINQSQDQRRPEGADGDHKPHEVRLSPMSVGLALLVSADPVTIQQFSLALRELSISPDACKDAASAGLLLKRRKFDAVIVDLQLGEQSGLILDEVYLSASNRTAVSFSISNSDAETTADFREKAQFVFERPLSPQSIHQTLKPVYGLILRERRRYFRCPISIPVIIQRENRQEIRCNSVNISGGGMALSTQVPLVPGEKVCVQFTLPDHEAPVLAESTVCWSKTGRLGVRFVSLASHHNSELQGWLSQKLEQMLPEVVADQFRRHNVTTNSR
jgi:diguanylate cyclase (GGDEF)-like protein/PAS domain S-box-containing protein